MKTFLFKPVVILAAIIALASFVRLYRLASVPPSPYWEEVALGYDAYSIAKTGKDFHGNPYPILAFPSYGDYKPSGYFYAIVPFIKLLGLNVAAVRFPSAVAGILSVLFIYLIGKELFDEKAGLVACLLLAISPWAIQFSRGGWEVNLSLMMMLAGTFFLIASRKRALWLPLSVVFFGLSMYTYHAARLFAPLIGVIGVIALFVYWWYRMQFKSKTDRMRILVPVVVAGILALGFVTPFLINLKNPVVSSRFTQTTIFSDLDPVLTSNAEIAKHGNTLLARLLYHRYRYYGGELLAGWISHFTPEFLFVRGDGNLRHWNGRYGELYPLDSIFLAVTITMLIASWKYKHLRKFRWQLFLIIVWICLAALPAAISKPTPHALRDLYAAPAYVLLTAFGILGVITLLKGRARRGVMAAIIAAYVYLFGSYFYWYLNIYPTRASQDWQYGYRQVFTLLQKEKKPDEKVYMTRDEGRPSMYYLFYSNYDPARIQAAGPSLSKDQLELLRVDDYYFVDSLPSVSGLFATPESKVDPHAKIIGQVRRLDGSIVWVVWRR